MCWRRRLLRRQRKNHNTIKETAISFKEKRLLALREELAKNISRVEKIVAKRKEQAAQE